MKISKQWNSEKAKDCFCFFFFYKCSSALLEHVGQQLCVLHSLSSQLPIHTLLW